MLIKAAFIDQKYSKTVKLCNIFTIETYFFLFLYNIF